MKLLTFLILTSFSMSLETLDQVLSQFEGTWVRSNTTTNTEIESFEQIKNGIWLFSFESHWDSFVISSSAVIVTDRSNIQICSSVRLQKKNLCVGSQKNQRIVPLNNNSFVWEVMTGNDLSIRTTYSLISETRMQKTTFAFRSGAAKQAKETVFYDRVQTQ